MDCVLDVVRGVLASIKGGDVEKVGGIPRILYALVWLVYTLNPIIHVLC